MTLDNRGDVSILIEVVLILVFAYVLPMIHVLRSPRTAPNMRVFWCGAVVCFGIIAYMLWWMMTTSQPSAKDLDSARLSELPVGAEDGKAVLYLMRWGFAGMLVNHRVALDDRNAPPIAEIRGRRCVAVQIEPGTHTLFVKSGKWYDFPFVAKAGQTLAFSLNTKAESAFANTLEGWLDDPTTRYQVARLYRAAA